MADQHDRIEKLNEKLEALLNKQDGFAKELKALYREIEEVKKLGSEPLTSKEKTESKDEEIAGSIEDFIPLDNKVEAIKKDELQEPILAPQPIQKSTHSGFQRPKSKSSWEKFIGENLINKVGIAILIIGVVIGAKYSIENNLISPLTRIVLGYLSGLGLLGFGIKLKAKYENYSAVLVSGALTILYFITFSGYSFYDLFPQLMAFGLMVVFTVFGVVAALKYNKQIIAHIGLVGAYAIPFLLSNDSGSAITLFSYVAIINIGILVIAFRKYWKPLYYSAFIFTWLIFGSFYAFSYETTKHFTIALVFICIFFALFYGIFLAYKLKANENFRKSDVAMLLLNSFIFYGLGYGLLNNHELGKELLGVFTLCNAFIHFVVSTILFRKKLADRNLFYLVSGLVLVFITIAIPVQLDGNWVTLLWALEAALLFWIGRTKNAAIYEYLSYPLMVLAFFSLLQDWSNSYGAYIKEDHFTSIANITFLSSLLFVACFGFINFIDKKTNSVAEVEKRNLMATVMSFGIPILFLLAIYGSFYLEIEYYWDKLFYNSEVEVVGQNNFTYSEYNYDLKDFGSIWLQNYTLFFISALAFINVKRIRNRVFGIVTLVLSLIVTLIFLTSGLYILSELRQGFLNEDLSQYHGANSFGVGIRYVAFGFFALFLFALHKLSQADFMKINFKVPFEIIMHVSILWILSSELLNWMDLSGSDQNYKLGLSILWGVYSLFLIVVGIFKTKSYLRIGGIVLFGITLLKLFFYDIALMNTITKTIVFVSLGILLLVISFLYNKYKNKISDEHED
ncbi:DUF2339 domain-containing protein [Maribacter algarum]|uniref:DUF2339 domain-containing protein n=1 Tax=Maribacter algarum (ex Zhang et al. 2020) TaxID=2578118 RepID=A0A5S3PGX9_9FLAO|nr:DUF2339 domain-containing protein [Maribacter algarum]TMM53365.1 DUF2339 domain-containing protein [Maribacter algarum]